MKKYLLTIFNNVDDAAKWMAMSPEERNCHWPMCRARGGSREFARPFAL
jgi:hypothetical protein